jgi:glycosyltransferase involved in cell wall biosynthesis
MEVVALAPHYKGAALSEDIDGIKIYRFPYFYPRRSQKLFYEGGVLPNLKRSFLAWLQVPAALLSELCFALWIVKKERINVIHSHWIIPSGLVGAVCGKCKGIGHLLTAHAGDVFALQKLPFKRGMANYIVKHSDKITAVSSYIGERLSKIVSGNVAGNVSSKMEIIPMGVYTQIFQKESNIQEIKSRYGIDSKFVLLSIGRLVEKKGFKYLIEAMPAILAENRDVKLVICGNGPMRGDLEALVKGLNIQDHVSFTGYVSGDKKIDYFCISDIVVVPSIVAGSGDTEGMPVVILEALAAGKPCVVTDVGGVTDVIKDGYNGFVIKQKDPAKIVEKVLELLNRDSIRRELSVNSLIDSQKYDWQIIGGKYVNVLRSITVE